MGKQGDTGTYWASREYDLVSHALCALEIIEEFIEASPSDCEGLWFLYDMKSNMQKIVDAYEPEGEPEKGYKDNVISFIRYRATKR